MITGIQCYQQFREVTFDHLGLILFLLIFSEDNNKKKKSWSCIVLNFRFPETGLELTEKLWSENSVRRQTNPKTTVLHFQIIKKKSQMKPLIVNANNLSTWPMCLIIFYQ